ncbi:MAG: ABC transporter substrate-binding protein [Limnochordales bacterium]|nr:ABC transporter substrate-binding protein [Limnochordales bacterium]
MAQFRQFARLGSRRAFGAGLVAALAALLVMGSGLALAQETVVIGMLGPLSGDYATYGTSVANGVELAINEANASGQYSYRFVLRKEDTRGDQTQALNAINKLIELDQVTAIVGAVLSGETHTAAPTAQDEGVPTITPSATASGISEIGDYIFRNVITDDVQALQMAEYAITQLGLKRFAILFANNDYGVSLRRAFEAGVRDHGGQVVAVESYLDGDSNFSAQLTNIAAQNPEALYIGGYYTEAAKIAQQAALQGLQVRLLGPDGFDSPELINLGGEAVEGALFTSGFYAGTTEPVAAEFVRKYKEAYGSEPDMFAANAYDSARILLAAIQAVGPNRAAVRDWIASVENFPGVTGPTTFDEKGDAVKPLYILRVQDGAFVQER